MSEIMHFEDCDLEIVTLNGRPWLRGDQIGTPLGLGHASRAVRKIFRRHQKEFTPEMTAQVELPTPGGPQMVRIFSPRGSALVAMLSRTERAAAFRAWVLDVLEGRTPEAALRAENARLAGQVESLQRLVLSQNGLWLQIARYHAMGLNTAEIARLVQRSRRRVLEIVQAMRSSGLIAALPAGRPLALPEARS